MSQSQDLGGDPEEGRVKQGKRNVAIRFILAKGDKERIAAWKQDLVRVLHVFNVRSIGPVEHSCT
jgi:hypothetical protein